MATDLISIVFEVLLVLLTYFMSSGLSLIATKALIPHGGQLSVVLHRSIYIPVMVLTLLLIRRRFAGWDLADLGFRTGEGFRANLRDGLIAFSASYLAYLPFLAVLMPQYAAQIVFGEHSGDVSLHRLGLKLLFFSPVVLIDSPVPEEIFFRGYYLGMLSKSFKPVVGISASTLFFALGHALNHPDWSPGLVFATIPIGLILAYTYHETRSLISVVTSHFLINFLPLYPILFYSKEYTPLAALTCLVIAIVSLTILKRYKNRTEELLCKTKPMKLLNYRLILLVTLFTALPLLFSYLAIVFKS
ncbi:MAG: CPBP family intramembrane glutamic endopeptidase [Candidatus Bathyarchaeia archaeon]